jgi:hypothetical protein
MGHPPGTEGTHTLFIIIGYHDASLKRKPAGDEPAG